MCKNGSSEHLTDTRGFNQRQKVPFGFQAIATLLPFSFSGYFVSLFLFSFVFIHVYICISVFTLVNNLFVFLFGVFLCFLPICLFFFLFIYLFLLFPFFYSSFTFFLPPISWDSSLCCQQLHHSTFYFFVNFFSAFSSHISHY